MGFIVLSLARSQVRFLRIQRAVGAHLVTHASLGSIDGSPASSCILGLDSKGRETRSFDADRASPRGRWMKLRGDSGSGSARTWTQGVGDLAERRRLLLPKQEATIVQAPVSWVHYILE